MFINTLKLAFLAQALNIALKPWGTPLTNVAGYLLILCTIFLPITIVLDSDYSLKEMDTNTIISIGLFFIVSISFILSYPENSIDLEFVKNLLCFVCLYISISTPPKLFRMRDRSHFFILGKILGIIFITYTFLPFSFRYTLANEWGYYAFTLSLGNTNATAIQVFVCILIIGLEIVSTKKKLKKIGDYTIIGFLIYIIYLLQCRTIMLCSILYITLIMVKKITIKKWWTYIALLIPIISIGIQILIREDSVTILGKGIVTGRDEIFVRYIDIIKQAPFEFIFGQLCRFRLNNYHNGPITLLTNIGLIGLEVCLLLWGSIINKSIETYSNDMQKMAIVSILLYLIHSSTEAAPMIGMPLFGIPVILFFRFAKDTHEMDNKTTSIFTEYTIQKCKYIR